MSDIHFQIAVGAYVFIGAMGLSFGAIVAACALHALASVGRNAKRQDRETGLGPKGEHAVGEASETPNLPPDPPE